MIAHLGTVRIGHSIEVGGVQAPVPCLERTGERASARLPPRRCASRAVRSAGPEVGEDLVDHRRLGDAGDGAHRAVAGRARQRVHLTDLLEERRPPAGAALSRMPPGRLAYQP